MAGRAGQETHGGFSLDVAADRGATIELSVRGATGLIHAGERRKWRRVNAAREVVVALQRPAS